MKKFNLLLYSVVLWTLIVCGNARRLSRSLDVEGAGGNLTQKHHEEVIQSDGLQHFTVAPKTHPQVVAKQETKDTTPSFIKEVPAIQEDINIQSLKNDDPFDLKYGRKLPSDNEEHKEVSASNANKTIKNFSNDIIPLKFNYTENSEVEKRKGVTSQLPSDVKEGVEKQEVQSITSSTETLKVDQEWKNLEMKKKEKGKKEILDTVTVPNDHNGAGRIEKPFKDNANNIKLKDKIKDSNTEASDDRRSTTIRISSSSSSISLGNHDNNKSPSSISFPLGDTPITSEGAVNQSVISVINNNGVYSDPSQKRVKYSLKRAHDIANDTDGDNSSSNGNLLNEDAANDSLPGLNLESQVSPSTFQTSTTGMEKMAVAEQKTSFPRLKPTESTPTKIDMLKVVIPSSSTIVKPSLAFKQQLVNKLKGLDPSPTMPVNFNGEELDENQEKSNSKSSTKPLRKKPKLDYLSSTSEMLIPPTATAWTLASLKTTAESSSPPRGPIQLYGETSTGTLDLLTRAGSKPTTVTPVSRVKGFVPWSTRLLKSTTSRTPPTADIDGSKSQVSTEVQEQQPSLDEQSKKKLDLLKEPLKLPPTSTTGTEGHSIIRTTTELERNMTETSFNTIPSSVNDIMVKDQSTTRTHSASTTEGVVRSLEQIELQSPINNSDSDANKTPAEKENVIETKLLEESNIKENVEIESPEKIKKDLTSNTKNNTANEVLLSDLSQNVNEIKPGNINDILNYTKSTLSPVEAVDSSKIKIISETSEIDPASSDVMIDGGGEDGKSGEDSDENEKTKQTTTPPPPPALFEPLETTMTLDLDEDFIESDEVSVPEVIESLNNASTTNRTMNTISPKPTEKVVEAKTTTSIVPVTKENSTGTYVTSFEIVSKDNSTQVVTKAPSEGDKNWYKIETKPVLNGTEEEKSSKTVFIEITTTTTVDTTIEPETATETSMQETTVVPDTSQTAVTVSTTTASTAGTELPESVIPEYGNPEDDDDLSSCVQIRVTCQDPQQLKEYLASQLMNENIAWEQVQVMGRELQDCETKDLTEEDERLEITVCFIDKDEKPSSAIRKEFLRLHSKRISDTIIPVVDLNTAQPPEMESGFDNVLAAIILSVIAAICLILLGILLVIIRKRQGKFNYGQRCTPVSLDDYSLDNISVYNSTRRKGAMRASKRSYGNPAFDDPGGPTHSVNFAGLANFSNDREALDEEFNQLPMITVKPDELPTGAESKNRYANVIPLPETRVLLQVKEGADPLDEYINANYIKGQKGQEKLYIACQAPLQSTIEDFWKMVWQQQTKVILMLTSLNENGVEKCADYLPQLEVTDCHRLFGDFQVTLKKHEVREKYIISNLQVKNLETNLWREVTHLWFSSWPPQGVPDDGSAMIAFLIEARSYMRGAQGPTVVHCSPGTGRTGTVIAIDLCIRDFETQRTVDIPKTVYALRRDRAGAVQTKDQYAFIYQVLNLYATKLTGGALDSI